MIKYNPFGGFCGDHREITLSSCEEIVEVLGIYRCRPCRLRLVQRLICPGGAARVVPARTVLLPLPGAGLVLRCDARRGFLQEKRVWNPHGLQLSSTPLAKAQDVHTKVGLGDSLQTVDHRIPRGRYESWCAGHAHFGRGRSSSALRRKLGNSREEGFEPAHFLACRPFTTARECDRVCAAPRDPAPVGDRSVLVDVTPML